MLFAKNIAWQKVSYSARRQYIEIYLNGIVGLLFLLPHHHPNCCSSSICWLSSIHFFPCSGSALPNEIIFRCAILLYLLIPPISTTTICFYSYHTFWKLTIRCSAYQVLHLNQKRRNQRNLNIRKNLKDTYHTHIVMRLLLKENWGGCTCTCSTRVAKLEGLAGNTDGMNKISFGTNF